MNNGSQEADAFKMKAYLFHLGENQLQNAKLWIKGLGGIQQKYIWRKTTAQNSIIFLSLCFLMLDLCLFLLNAFETYKYIHGFQTIIKKNEKERKEQQMPVLSIFLRLGYFSTKQWFHVVLFQPTKSINHYPFWFGIVLFICFSAIFFNISKALKYSC